MLSVFLLIFVFGLVFPVRASAAFQPTSPYYTTFYYPWYKNTATDGAYSYWNDNDAGGGAHNPPTNWFSNYLPDYDTTQFSPSTELYSTNDADVVYWQLTKMAEAKIEVAISSWWGQGDKTDTAFNFIISDVMNRSDNPYPNLRWSLYYEDESTGDPSAATIVSDLTYIYDNYASEPGMLKIGGEPVIFVYADGLDGAGMASRWASAMATMDSSGKGFYYVLKVFTGYASDPNQPDSWHQYAPAVRQGQHGTYSYYVSPGFWKDGESERLCRNLNGAAQTNCDSASPASSINSFQTAVQSMVSASTTWKLIETWNEWGEGTSVEPGTPVTQANDAVAATEDGSGYTFQNSYIDVLSAQFPVLENGTGYVSSSSNNNSSSVTSVPGASVCGDSTPATPILYSAEANSNTSVEIKFYTPAEPYTGYIVQYGTDSGNYQYGAIGLPKSLSSFDINLLAPNTDYYIRVASVNGCAPSGWSQELKARTSGRTSTSTGTAPTPTSSSQTTQPEIGGYTVNIKVTDENEQPVEGATVTLHSVPRENKTGADGVARFENVEPGDHKVLISYNNYEGSQNINLNGDITHQFNIDVKVEKVNPFTDIKVIGVIGVLGLVVVSLGIMVWRKR